MSSHSSTCRVQSSSPARPRDEAVGAVSRPQAGRRRAGGGRDGAGHIAGEAAAGLPAVRPRPQAPAADTRAGIRKKIQRKQTETFLFFLRKTYFKESQVRE